MSESSDESISPNFRVKK